MTRPRSRIKGWERWFGFLVTISIIIIWEILARNGLVSNLFFPAPSIILQTLWKLILNGRIPTAIGATMLRVLLGVVCGVIPGVIIGLGMGWSRKMRNALDPIVAALNPLPKLSIFPLIMIVLGIGEISKVFTIAITTFFPMLINSMAGVRQLNPVYFEVAQNYGANRWQKFTRVIFPGALPMILAGFRIAFNLAFTIAIAVELLTANTGLGVLIWFSWETLQTENLYATLIIIALIGYLINFTLQKSSFSLTPWYFRTKADAS